MTLSITTPSIMGLFATLSINDTQLNNTAIMLNVICWVSFVMLMVAFNLLLCWMSLCWESWRQTYQRCTKKTAGSTPTPSSKQEYRLTDVYDKLDRQHWQSHISKVEKSKWVSGETTNVVYWKLYFYEFRSHIPTKCLRVLFYLISCKESVSSTQAKLTEAWNFWSSFVNHFNQY